MPRKYNINYYKVELLGLKPTLIRVKSTPETSQYKLYGCFFTDVNYVNHFKSWGFTVDCYDGQIKFNIHGLLEKEMVEKIWNAIVAKIDEPDSVITIEISGEMDDFSI